MDLLKPRLKPAFGRIEAVVLGLYTVLVGCITYYHEPWTDEAQAWLIARDSSLGDLFLKRLHYEGSSGLWHLLLWIFTRLHISYAGMHWATDLIAIASVYVLLRYSPFPLLVRVALPFTFPLVFQTAILARSYSLVPLFIFLICIVLSSARNRPLLLAILLGLLANTSIFAFVLALSIIPLYLIRLKRSPNRPPARSLLVPGTVLTLLFLFAMYTALPAADISYGPGRTFALHRHVSHLLSVVTKSQPAPNDPVANLPMKPKGPDPEKQFLDRHFGSHVSIGHKFMRVKGAASLAFYTVSNFNLLAILFYALLILQQRHYRALITSLPLLLILAAGQYLGMGDHHTSLIAVTIVLALWLTWSNVPATTPNSLDRVFQFVLLAVLIEQMAWTAHAAIYDIREPFDGSKDAAQFIIPKADHYRVAAIGVDDLAIEPYAPHNIFYNESSTYWPWRVGNNPEDHVPEIVAQHPDFILDSDSFSGDTLINNQLTRSSSPGQNFDLRDKSGYLLQHGYHETHRFCGRQPAHFGFARETCLVVYEPFK